MTIKKWIEIVLIFGIFYLSWQIVLKLESQNALLIDPLASLYQYSGWIGFAFIVGSLVVFAPFKKSFGILGFIGILVHFLIFLYLDFNFDFTLILEELRSKAYLYFGIFSFLLLCVCMGATFFGVFRFYYLVYGAIFLAILHILLIQKVLSFKMICVLGVVGVLLLYKVFRAFKKRFFKVVH
ncbi:hypothetical protein [Helicobacter burdigaliensis]|uniref:hypothetical protein n=1 Tax=Helicobacter burdigaliensis TaxID=2315334 RepID=UPI001300AA47|nr:hypothetical protein [Helicobacter burdigaliensis]